MHEFEIKDYSTGELITIGKLDKFGLSNRQIMLEEDTKISQYFSLPEDGGYYVYDFGDYWRHQILLERVFL